MEERFTLWWKILTLFGLVLVMFIPVIMIMGIIGERADYQREVIRSVSLSSSGSQTLMGPFIVLPYTETYTEVHNKQAFTVTHDRVRYFLPEQLNVTGDADISTRNIGIYQTQIYQTDFNFSGTFGEMKFNDLDESERMVLGEPYLVMLISDTRGIMQIPLMILGDSKIKFESGIKRSGIGSSAAGIHAPLTLNQLEQNNLVFNINLQIRGTENLSVVPLGNTSHYTLTANWPHPSFIGDTLPTSHTITDEGFSALWQSSWYANNINSYFNQDLNLNRDEKICSNDYQIERCFSGFKTSFVETVDQYQLTERAVKYEALFVILIFVSFFLFETLKQLRIHPMQYLLVGMALVLFYLILLALSEHIGFLLAYIFGAIACSSLIGFYLSAILNGIKRGFLFSGFLLILYAVLYFVLISEGNALLLGAGLLFAVLAAIMILTRKIDWYQLSEPKVKTNSVEKIV